MIRASRDPVARLCALLVLGCVLPYGGAVASETIDWTADVREALLRARAASRPVVVDVWAVWCEPCRKMEETTYRDAAVVEAMGAVVPLKVDADADTVFVDRYRAAGALPTTLFLDGDGEVIGRMVGSVEPDRMAAALRMLLDGYGTYLRERERRKDPDSLRIVAGYLDRLGNHEGEAELLERALKLARKAGRPADEIDLVKVDLAIAEAHNGRSNAAAESLSAIVEETSSAEVEGRALLALVDLERARGRPDLSEQALLRLKAAHPALLETVRSVQEP